MGNWKIVWSPRARREYARLNPVTRKRIRKRINELRNNPYIGTKIRDSRNKWRTRVGRYRIVYGIFKKVVTVKLLYIFIRKDSSYRRF